MSDVAAEIDTLARSSDFSGVVSVSRSGDVTFERAYGLADRAHRIPVTSDTRFGIASGTKAFTALTVENLIADGTLDRTTPARSVLGADLPLIGGDVTIDHLLTHTSGIGDYVDEDVIDASEDTYLLSVPVHRLDTTTGYLAALDGIPAKFPAGRRFAYCNSGYVVLALIAERVSGRSFPGLVGERVLGPAEMYSTAFLRMDALPGDAAIGYLQNGRTNVLHLPVRGSGDGGAFTTAADLRRFWTALFAGRLLPLERVREMVRPRPGTGEGTLLNGVGFWADPRHGTAVLTGGDIGVSFFSVHAPRTRLTYSVLSNTGRGAGPMDRRLEQLLLPV
jgi:CubicO group peptidase (beta-lactamase class C family)